MIIAYIVYLSLLVFMLSCAKLSIDMYKYNSGISYWNITILFPVIAFSLVLGLRYNVGIDYLNYYNTYVEQFNYVFSIRFEPGFNFLYRILYFLRAKPGILFIIIAFIQIVVFYRVFRDKIVLLPFAVFLLFVSCHIFGMLNTLRQSISVLFLLWSIEYIYREKLSKFFICFLMACCFHYSSFVFLPIVCLYWLRKPFFFDTPWFQLTVFIVCITFQSYIYNSIIHLFITMMSEITNYSLPLIGGKYQVELGSGIGKIVNYIIVVFLVFMSGKLYKIFGIVYLQYYRVFYVGQIITIIAGLDMNLRRIGSCYKVASLVVLPYVCYYIFTRWKVLPVYYRLLGGFIIGMYILIFFYKIYMGENRCSPFQFIG